MLQVPFTEYSAALAEIERLTRALSDSVHKSEYDRLSLNAVRCANELNASIAYAEGLKAALERAEKWLINAPHSRGCYRSQDIGSRCLCGLESARNDVQTALAAERSTGSFGKGFVVDSLKHEFLCDAYAGGKCDCRLSHQSPEIVRESPELAQRRQRYLADLDGPQDQTPQSNSSREADHG